MNQIFQTQKTITFREADPAGIMFFGNIFGFAHDAYEEFIQTLGISRQEWFEAPDFIVPIKNTDAQYMAPFLPGVTYDVAVTVTSLGTSSFQLRYTFGKNGKTHAIVTTLHVLADKQMQKRPLSEGLQLKLKPYLETPT